MVYLILDTAEKVKPMLVKVECKSEVTERLRLSDTQKFSGTFTNNEISTLDTTSFAAICS